MALGDFVLVVGEDWIEVPNATQVVEGNAGFNQVQEWIRAMEWVNMSAWMEGLGLIAENSVISDARLYDTGGPQEDYVRLFYKP